MALIHKFKQGNDYYVIDVNSGAVHIVDEIVYDLLDENKLRSKEELIEEFKGKYKEEELSEVYDELKELVAEGMLYSLDLYENIAKKSGQGKSYFKA